MIASSLIRKMLAHPSRMSFATAAEIAQRTLSKFQKRYGDQTDAFAKRMYDSSLPQGVAQQAVR